MSEIGRSPYPGLPNGMFAGSLLGNPETRHSPRSPRRRGFSLRIDGGSGSAVLQNEPGQPASGSSGCPTEDDDTRASFEQVMCLAEANGYADMGRAVAGSVACERLRLDRNRNI